MTLVNDVLSEGRRIEKRVADAQRRALGKLADGISINDLAAAIVNGDLRKAKALLPVRRVRDVQAPAAAIIRDTVLKGGKLAARELSKEGR